MKKEIIRIQEVDFLDYISGEEYNFLSSFHHANRTVTGRDGKTIPLIFDAFFTLDQLFKIPMRILKIDPEQDMIGALFVFVHFHFYFSISCHFRIHNAEGLASTRKAIDASLSAYMMMIDPSSIEKYKARDHMFKSIKTTIKHRRKQDPSRFLLADPLITFHEYCSQFGSHADISGFINRIQRKGSELFVHYFEEPSGRAGFQLDLAKTLMAYLDMLEIFRPFLRQKMEVEFRQAWEDRIDTFRSGLNDITSKLQAAT